mgnify:CR=1 FL=1
MSDSQPDPAEKKPMTPEEIERRRQAALRALEQGSKPKPPSETKKPSSYVDKRPRPAPRRDRDDRPRRNFQDGPRRDREDFRRGDDERREYRGSRPEQPAEEIDERSHGQRDYDARHDPDSAHYIEPERDQRHDYPGYADPNSENYLPRPEIEEEEIVERIELPDDAPKPSPRRQNRIAAMQFLYMCESSHPEEIKDAIYSFFTTRDEEREFYAFGEELALGAWENRAAVDEAIAKHASNWTLDRIAKVDLAILRLAIYELLFRRDIPPIVSINEAIDLSKSFSTPEAKRFINGILDKFKETLDRPLRTADV